MIKIRRKKKRENKNREQSLEIVQKIKVVNDAAKRGIKLIQEYNSKLKKKIKKKKTALEMNNIELNKHFPYLI